MKKIRNGECWKQANFPYCEGIVQWLDGDVWCLMSVPEKGINGWTVSIPTSDKSGKIFYSAADLLSRLESRGYAPAEMVAA